MQKERRNERSQKNGLLRKGVKEMTWAVDEGLNFRTGRAEENWRRELHKDPQLRILVEFEQDQ